MSDKYFVYINDEDVFEKKYPIAHKKCRDMLGKVGWTFHQCYYDAYDTGDEIDVCYGLDINEDHSATFLFDDEQNLKEYDLNNID